MSDICLKNTTKRVYTLTAIICGLIFVVSSFLLKPLNISFSTDIMLMDSWVMYVFEALLILCEVAAYSVMFAAVIKFVFEKDSKPLRLILLCAIICTLRRIADVIMTVIFYGALTSEDIYLVVFYIGFEFLQLIIVWLFAQKLKNRAQKDVPMITKVFDKENPLQVCALLAGALLSLVKIVSRIIYDVSYSLFIGPPESIGEILAMVIYYLSDVSIAFVSYALIIVAFKLFGGSRK